MMPKTAKNIMTIRVTTTIIITVKRGRNHLLMIRRTGHLLTVKTDALKEETKGGIRIPVRTDARQEDPFVRYRTERFSRRVNVTEHLVHKTGIPEADKSRLK